MDTRSLYRLPWSADENPSGWIEVTTYCQLQCPGCYRGLAENHPARMHEDLGKLKHEIDELIRLRNIQTLSIAGGEPLLYPHLKEVIAYAHAKGLKTKIFTNGCSLAKERLLELKAAGATEFVIHIDKFQKRPGVAPDADTNELREQYCSLFREVGDVNLGFIMPISGTDFSELSDVIELCKRNVDVVNLLVLTPYKNMLPGENTYVRMRLLQSPVEKLSEFLCEHYRSKPCAFLGKTHSKNTPSWLFIIPLFYKGRIIGYVDSRMYHAFQERYRSRKGKYFITVKGNKISPSSLLPFAYTQNGLGILANLAKHTLRNAADPALRYQVVLIIDGPELVNGSWDLCDGCPDAMLHEGTLVPSCLLERIKDGEKITIPQGAGSEPLTLPRQ